MKEEHNTIREAFLRIKHLENCLSVAIYALKKQVCPDFNYTTYEYQKIAQEALDRMGYLGSDESTRK